MKLKNGPPFSLGVVGLLNAEPGVILFVLYAMVQGIHPDECFLIPTRSCGHVSNRGYTATNVDGVGYLWTHLSNHSNDERKHRL